ncbi:MAG: hypothetical protein MR380_06705 [Lachnospiraceae bacterium]|nr:hypothetical protein [Lachnospiraceae bacterium]
MRKKEKGKKRWENFLTRTIAFCLTVVLIAGTVVRGSMAEEDALFYPVSTEVEGEGRILLSKDQYEPGEEVSFTLEPAAGYEKESLHCYKDTDGNEEVPLIKKEEEQELYGFVMPDCSVQIRAGFLRSSKSTEFSKEIEEEEEDTTEQPIETGKTEDTVLTEEKDEPVTKQEDEKEQEASFPTVSSKVMLPAFLDSLNTKTRASGDIGVKQVLDYSLSGSGTSYLNFLSPTGNVRQKVSLHRTSDNQIAYCMERTKTSDQDDFNWNYDLVSNKDTRFTDLQRNILLCGYPGNSLAKLEDLYGYSVNGRTGEQATQLAIWIGNYMIREGATLQEAWEAHAPYNAGEYQGAELCKAILKRAYDMLSQSLSVKADINIGSDGQGRCVFELTTKGQYYPVTGTITGMPEGTKIQTDSTITCSAQGNFKMNLVKGTGKITLTFSKYAKASKICLLASSSIPIPPSYSGILFYDNRDSSYQPVAVVKEVKPFYGKTEKEITWEPEPVSFLHLKKTSEDGKNAGIRFHLEGPDSYSKEFQTDEKGEIDFGMLYPGTYTITEESLSRYVTPKPQTITLKNGDDKTVTFSNILRKMIIQIEKKDSKEGGTAQGDGSLVGAVYGIYDESGKQVDTLVIGENHKANSKKLPVGVYKVKETKASTGYNLDPSVYTVDGRNGDPSLEIVSYLITSKEKVIEGKVSIVKILENPDTLSEETIPAKGVRFVYYLNSNPSVKMSFTLDENGMGESDWMPYGTYTLEEEEVPKGWKSIAPKTVEIQKEGETLSYYLVDRVDGAWCKIIKKDKETGKTIAYPGTRFQIRKKDTNQIVSMNVTYPVQTKIDEFTTNEEGILMLPEKLQAGDYLLYELDSPYGYVKSEEPVEFTILEQEEKIVEIVMENVPQVTELCVKKTGAVFFGKEEKQEEEKTLMIPVYEQRPLKGAVFSLTALEEICTMDGSCRMEKGESIKAITDEKGEIQFSNLYPGRYELKEEKAPDGFLSDTEPKEVRILYGDSSVTEQKKQLTVSNRQQIPELIFSKRMGTNPYLHLEKPWEEVLYGVYAGEDLKGQSCSGKEEEVLIPEGTLVDFYRIGENGEGISQYQSPLPYGAYYLQEICTHEAYELDTKRYDFQFTFQSDGEEKQKIILSEEAFQNNPIEGTLKIRKEETGTKKGLSDCKIQVKDSSGAVLVQKTTDEKGEVCFFRLPAGIYTYQEVKAPKGYQKEDKEISFEIVSQGQIVKATLENQPKPEKEKTNTKPKKKTEQKTKGAKTGDSTPLFVSVFFTGISLFVLILILIWKKKKEGK